MVDKHGLMGVNYIADLDISHLAVISLSKTVLLWINLLMNYRGFFLCIVFC